MLGLLCEWMHEWVQKQFDLINCYPTCFWVQGALVISFHCKAWCWSFGRERYWLCTEIESPAAEGGDEQITEHPGCSCILQEDEDISQVGRAYRMVLPCPKDKSSTGPVRERHQATYISTSVWYPSATVWAEVFCRASWNPHGTSDFSLYSAWAQGLTFVQALVQLCMRHWANDDQQ